MPKKKPYFFLTVYRQKLKMAKLARITGNKEESEKWLQKMMEQDPDFAQPYHDLAVLAQERGRVTTRLRTLKNR